MIHDLRVTLSHSLYICSYIMFRTRKTAIKRAGGATTELAKTIAAAVKQLGSRFVYNSRSNPATVHTESLISQDLRRVRNHKTKTAVTSAYKRNEKNTITHHTEPVNQRWHYIILCA